MNRQEIFTLIENERAYQDKKWGTDFDDKNTPNDWVAYINKYLGQAVSHPFDENQFHNNLLKVASLCVAAVERDSYPPRHYDV